MFWLKVVPDFFFRLSAMLSMTGGTMFLLWLGEQITQRGVGNGISLIIYIGILSSLPQSIIAGFANIGDLVQLGQNVLTLAVTLALVVLVVFVERCVRKVPVQYPHPACRAISKWRRTISSCRLKLIPLVSSLRFLPPPSFLATNDYHVY